jgi:ribosomal 50S subunit-recycling heat shock protein
MLEGQLRLDVDQATGHDQVLRHPACALLFEGLDLMPGGAVKFLTRDILIDLGRTFAVRAVGAANVLRVGNPGRALFPGVGTVIVEGTTLATTLGTVAKRLTLATVVAERTTLLAITTRPIKVPRATLRAATEGLTLATVVVEGTTLTITGRTISAVTTVAEGLTVTIAAEGTTLAIAGRAVAKRLTLATVVVERTTLTITRRTISAVTTVAEGLTVTIAAEGTTLAIAGRAVAKRLTLATVVVERTTLTITRRTISAVTAVAEGLTVTIATKGTTLLIAVAILPGTESARISTGVVVGAERTAVTAIPAKVPAIAVAIAAVVLSHGGFLLLRADHWRVRSRS